MGGHPSLASASLLSFLLTSTFTDFAKIVSSFTNFAVSPFTALPSYSSITYLLTYSGSTLYSTLQHPSAPFGLKGLREGRLSLGLSGRSPLRSLAIIGGGAYFKFSRDYSIPKEEGMEEKSQNVCRLQCAATQRKVL